MLDMMYAGGAGIEPQGMGTMGSAGGMGIEATHRRKAKAFAMLAAGMAVLSSLERV